MRRVIWLLLPLVVLPTACGDDDQVDVAVEESSELSTQDDSSSERAGQDDGDWRTVELLWFEEVSETDLEATMAYCGDSYRLDVVETADAVTVRAETSDPASPPAPDCATSGTIVLESALGSRTVVDAATGASVPQR